MLTQGVSGGGHNGALRCDEVCTQWGDTHGHLAARHVHGASCASDFAGLLLRARSVFTDCAANACMAACMEGALQQCSADIMDAAPPDPIAGVLRKAGGWESQVFVGESEWTALVV